MTADGPRWGRDGQLLPVQGRPHFLLSLPRLALAQVLAGLPAGPHTSDPLLAPLEALHQVWASGVTYQRSRAARRKEAAVDRLLSSSERPTAIFGFTDDYTLPLLKALLERETRVLDDVAMVGTEDTYLCGLVHPALTSVRFDMQTIGAHQVDIADALIRNREPACELFVTPLPQLIVRGSS